MDMAIPDEFLYEYAVVRYVPRVEREEFVNIGLLMMCKRRKWMKGEIRLDRDRILAFDSNVNFPCLEQQSSLFTRLDVPRADIPVEERYRWLTAVKSAVLQVSSSHPGYIPEISDTSARPEDLLEEEFRRLFSRLVC